MISLDGSESQMALRKGKRQPASTRYHLTEGWNAFMHSNNISQGDKCVFKYIKSEDKMCLAKIIKALATEVYVEDVNPSFVVTITTMHTTRLVRFTISFVKDNYILSKQRLSLSLRVAPKSVSNMPYHKSYLLYQILSSVLIYNI